MKGDSDTETKKSDKEKSRGSRAHKFFEKLNFVEISGEIEDKEETVEKKNSESEDKKEKNNHSFSTMSDLLGSERIKKIKAEKNKILMVIGIIAGILLVIFGMVLMMTASTDKVADNVIFGEKDIFSVFLILIGVLLIAISLAYHFIGKSFFNRIDKKIESYDKMSSDSGKDNIKKDNINRNNR